LAGIEFQIRSEATRARGGTGYVVLGTEVPGLGFNLLEPIFEIGSRVIDEVFFLVVVEVNKRFFTHSDDITSYFFHRI
jgi:hypothetical protein